MSFHFILFMAWIIDAVIVSLTTAHDFIVSSVYPWSSSTPSPIPRPVQYSSLCLECISQTCVPYCFTSRSLLTYHLFADASLVHPT